MGATQEASVARRRVGLSGVRRCVDDFLAAIDGVLAENAADPGAAVRMAGRISFAFEKTERSVVRRNLSAADLTDSARTCRAWLRHFSEPTHVGQLIATCRTAETLVGGDDALLGALRARLGGRRNGLCASRPLRLDFRPQRSVTRASIVNGRIHLEVTPALYIARADVIDAVLRVVAGDAPSRQTVHEAMLTDDIQAMIGVFESRHAAEGPSDEDARHGPSDGNAAGLLVASFDRVNEKYFGQAMKRPRLDWSRRLSSRVFGHYEFVGDTIVLNTLLSEDGVPAWVLDFVMYHELLHKKHGLRWSGTRAMAHTAAFRADERRFERYEEAERFLRRLARARRRARRKS